MNGYAKKGGMQEDRNAVFATYEDGVKAYKHLVFEREPYKNSAIRSVIYNYAPPKENNTEWYIQQAMRGIPGEYRNIKMRDWPEKYRDKLMENMFKVEGTGKITKEEKIGVVEN